MVRKFTVRWKIEMELPTGGQAFVHKVTDKSGKLNGQFVLKRLKNPRRLDRFTDEVLALKELEHEGITKLVDFDLEDDRPWFVQEYCEGGDLDDFVTKGKLRGPGQSFEFFIQISEALAYAHDKLKVHRDIKPANIFLRSPNGPAVLGDFGLTFVEKEEGDRLTLTHEQVGSRYYMAPELREGRLEDPIWSCDIYSLGKVLYFMLTKGRKFDRENFNDEMNDVVGHTDNVYLEHANNLFRKMITFDPKSRASAKSISGEARQAKRLVEERFPPLEGKHYSPCKYCGIGMYQPVANNFAEYIEFFGYQSHSLSPTGMNFRTMACDGCGHIQIFKIQKEGRDWWPVRDPAE